mgnify:CR=1 FL=1
MGEFLIFLLVLFAMFAIPVVLVVSYEKASTETQAAVEVGKYIGLHLLIYIVIGILSGGIGFILLPLLFLFENK